MGFSRKRTGTGGRVRYTAIYRDLRGRQRSAGSFATRREADRAWQRAEVMLGMGRVGEPARGRQTFEHYVEDTWFPNHQVEVTHPAGVLVLPAQAQWFRLTVWMPALKAANLEIHVRPHDFETCA